MSRLWLQEAHVEEVEVPLPAVAVAETKKKKRGKSGGTVDLSMEDSGSDCESDPEQVPVVQCPVVQCFGRFGSLGAACSFPFQVYFELSAPPLTCC